MMIEELDFKELFTGEIVERTFACFGFLKQSCKRDPSGLTVCRHSFAWPPAAAGERGDEAQRAALRTSPLSWATAEGNFERSFSCFTQGNEFWRDCQHFEIKVSVLQLLDMCSAMKK